MRSGTLAEQRLPAGSSGRQPHALARRLARGVGAAAAVVGAIAVVWVVVVWQWQDPFTALYTAREQHKLEARYEQRLFRFAPASPSVALTARRYRLSLEPGDPVGRLKIPRLGLSKIVVNGTSESDLKKGPGRYLGSFLPGEGQLIYVAGHRTTYGAPFAHIERLRSGDRVTLELPYGTFVYEVRRHVIVRSNDLRPLRSHGREVLALQACHPRFFATHRYIVYAVPVPAGSSAPRRSASSRRYSSPV